MPSVKTQGTQLFFKDSLSSSDPRVVRMACPTAVTGLGGAADQIDDTCLEDLIDRSFSPGLGNPGQVTIPFVLKPDQVSHDLLFDYFDAKEITKWQIALSDGTDVPVIDSDGNLTQVPTRTSFNFDGYVADVNIDIATNEVVRGTLVVQRSGAVTRNWKV